MKKAKKAKRKVKAKAPKLDTLTPLPSGASLPKGSILEAGLGDGVAVAIMLTPKKKAAKRKEYLKLKARERRAANKAGLSVQDYRAQQAMA